MQVNDAITLGGPRGTAGEPTTEWRAPRAGQQREALGLLAEFIELLRLDPRVRAAREVERADQREAALRRKDALQQQALAAAISTPRPSEIIFDAERNMLPGSHAARQEQLRGLEQRNTPPLRPAGRQSLPTPAATVTAEEPAACGPAAGGPSSGAKPAPAPATPNNAHAPSVATPAGEHRVHPMAPTAARSFTTAATGLPSGTGPAGQSALPVSALQRAVGNVAALATGKVAAGASAGAARAAGPAAAVADPGGRPATRSTAAARATASAPSNSDANVERILRLIHTRISERRSVATMRLEPPELGSIRLRMDLRGDRLTLELQTETAAAQRLLSEQLDALRRNLEAGGIQLERVEIRAPVNVVEPRGPDTPPQNDVPAGRQDARPQEHGPHSGGGGAGEKDFPVEPTVAEPPPEPNGVANWSRVNVWA